MHVPTRDGTQGGESNIVWTDPRATKLDAIAYWRSRLALITPTVFPLRSSPSHAVSDSYILRRFPVAHQSLSRDHGIELSTLITLAYALVLSAHSGSSDEVVFGYVHGGQRVTLPHNVEFDWSQMTLDFLRRLQDDMTQAEEHNRITLQDIPHPNVGPLFRTILNCYPSSTLADKFHSQMSHTDNFNYELAFFIRTVDPEEIEIETRYVPESISGSEVKVFQDHFGTALDSIFQTLTSPLRDVDLVSPAEKQRLIVKNNSPYPSETISPPAHNVTELIEKQARRTPRKIALQFGQEIFVTYQEMDTFANNLAHSLIARRVKCGDLVGIYMGKACEMFISILAIHKSGGGYIPLDPAHPAERIQTILSLVDVKIVLTSKELQNRFNSFVPARSVFSLAVDMRDLVHANKPDVRAGRDDISHVLFTSGSTGTPKGVILTHGSIVESLIGAHAVIGRRDDRVLQFSDYTFDVSVWDWSITLSDGGTLCIVPKRKLMDNLAEVAHSMDVTFLETTPTVLALITPEEVPSLQMLAAGGELLTPEVRNTWADAVSLINVYGPTEASTNVLARTGITSATEGSNIGWPFGLNILYVLDDRLRPVPLGCVGELFISGPQVARGYLNNPEQTAKAFIDDPFRPGSRMYATGDLVRMSPIDGSFSYLGRRDTQIKIHGLRVEIGEIETVLKTASNDITNAVVLKVNVGHDMLIAFLEYPSNLGNSHAEPTIIRDGTVRSILAVLRNTVRQRLPTYMAPGSYVVLDRFPLAVSGKLDRKALGNFFRAHEQEIRELRADSEHFPELPALEPRTIPMNERQAKLRTLWALILNLNEASLGIDDDFYTVGGDSISAIRLASVAREAGIPLLATDIIENPTIRTMTHITEFSVVNHDFDDDDIPSVTLDQMSLSDLTLMALDQKGLEALRYKLLPKHGIHPRDVLDIYPCTALQTSFFMAGLMVDRAYVVRQAYNLPPGTTSIKIRQAFEDFIKHPNGAFLRTVFVFDPLTNRFLQVLMRPTWKRMDWTTIVVADEFELDMAITNYQDGEGSVKFEFGELHTRACVFELNGVPRALAWSSHHALADHWTMNNAESDIGDMYASRPLPLRRSFKSMIKYLERLDRAAGVDFWRRHLLNAIPTPFLQPLPGAPRVIVNETVSRKVYTDYSSLTQQFGIMASSLITAAWSVVLSAHTGNAPIKDIDSMAGNTINTVPRRVILNAETSILQTLREIQSEQIEIGKHEHIALADLMSRGMPVSGLFKSLLNFVNLPGDQKEAASIDGATDYVLWNRRPGSLDGQDLPFHLQTLIVTPSSTDGFALEVNYTREVISLPTVQTILDHFEAAIVFLIRYPHQLIRDVELVSAHELQHLIPGLDTKELLSPVQNISELIELQVQKTPQRIALQFDQDIFLTYVQMDALSNNLAHKLIKSGVKRGTLIAIYMEKSIEMFLSILAVHKAGCGYVPLDPEHPAQRIRTIIQLAKTTMVLASEDLQDQLASALIETDVNAMLVDYRELSPAARPDVGSIGRDDVCHVLFTSGSTGTPKGVVLTHGSIVESAIGSREVIGALDGRVLQFSNYTFDVSVWDWSATLSAGGTLCIVPKQKLIDDLGNVARSLDVTFLETTPTVAALIKPEDVPSLQRLTVSGELLTPEVRNTWADAVSLVNAYGPTEASTNVIALKGVNSSTECANIGWRFGLNSVYVLDERLRPVPIGCVGELFIGGPQVARGYLNSPEETAKAFVGNPFRPGSIMYATGDLVSMSPDDGSFTFLDRRDTQIKIRGLRVEVGEIETIIKATSTVISNAAVLKVDIRQETLVAFLEYSSAAKDEDMVIIRNDSFGSLVASLKQSVHERLPQYMAPTLYVALNRFPLASSGKLDRKALHAYFHRHQTDIQQINIDSDGVHTAEEEDVNTALLTDLQATIRSLWASHLFVKESSLRIDDDFYMAGGDSISAIGLAGAAREAGLHLLATDIIRNPTIRAMAHIAESAAVNHDFDDDDIPSFTLDHMSPKDLTLLTLDQTQLDRLRLSLLPEHGLLASDVLDVYPTTGLQTSLLMAGLLVQDAYIISQSWNLPMGTDSTRLRQAFEDFIDHSNGMMFRTVFVFEPLSSRWLQVLVRPGAKRMEWTTVVVADEAELDLQLDEYEQGRAIQRFENGELLTRARVFEIDGCGRALVWSLHHALLDHWAMDIAISDIENVYAYRSVKSRRAFKPMIKYLEGLDRAPGLNFWRRHLENATPTPFLQPSPGSPRVTTNALVMREVYTGHGSFTRRSGIMPSTLVTGAWSIVLAVHSNCSDVVFGQVLAGRNAPIRDIWSMTGITINTVPRRIIHDSDTTVFDTLQRIQTEQIEISKHESITLADLQSEGTPVSALFKTILNFRNLPGSDVIEMTSSGEGGLFAKSRNFGRDGLDFPFALTVDVSSTDSLTVSVDYVAEIIHEAEVNAILDHFEAALIFLMRHPKAHIRDVDLISPKERQRLVPELKAEKLLSPVRNISDLIEQQVRKTPQRVALQFDQEMFLTYGQMDSLANDLAHKLIQRGVNRGTLVALYMDKSIEMFLSILAVHKAGAGYVPLDPEHPAERIQTIVRLAQTTIVLTTAELESQLSSAVGDTNAIGVLIDYEELSPAARPNVGDVGRNDICHILFTSGSTGTPKGVVLTHGSIIESAIASQDAIGPLHGRVLQFSNYTFDVSVWDWSATLVAGGTLCIVPKHKLINDLENVTHSLDITFLETTPTVVALITPGNVPSLQMLAVGGELLTAAVRNAWADEISLVNVYGPTEASTNVIAHKDVTTSTEGSKIGWSFGLNSVYVLDERMQLVPIGCVGELFISGPQVAQGYLNSPKETAKAFMNDPFHPGATMYATGDLVRISPTDGSINFLDRRDTQIKIRGLRVETGEIEAIIKVASNVITNAVVIKVDVGRENLVAFLEYPSHTEKEIVSIVRDDGLGSLLATVKHAVRAKLPSYMAPTTYVALNRFPRSSSGKLDRKALGAFFHLHEATIQKTAVSADGSVMAEHDMDAALLTEPQTTIRSLWAMVLRISEASLLIDDDFYTVGGDSIAAIRLAGAARERGLDLPATDIIRNPTIRAMAQIAESSAVNHDFDDDDTPSVTLDQMSTSDLTLLTLDQAQLDSLRENLLPQHGLSARLVILSPDACLSDVLDVYPTTGLQTSLLMAGLVVQDAYIISQAWNLPLGTDGTRLKQAFEDFIDHPNGMIFRTVFVFDPTSNRWLQVLLRPGAKKMEWTTIIVPDETELDSCVREYQQGRAIDQFANAHLLTRACVFQVGGSSRALVWSLHHALLDHWAMDIAISDLENVYAHRRLPPRRSFKPMIKYLERLDRTPSLKFWRSHLEKATPTPFLLAPPGTARATTNASVGREVRTGHGSFTRKSGIMPSTLATCAWSIVLAAHSNCTDVVFGQVLAGRNAPIRDIGSMTGITINTVARRVIHNPETTVLDMLRQVQTGQIEISKHETITLADLESEGIPVSGLFKSLLNFRNLPGADLLEGASSDRLFAASRDGGRDGLDFPFALTVDVSSSDSFYVGVGFVSEIITEAEVNAILDHFEAALLFSIHHPNERVRDVKLINDTELRRLIPDVEVDESLSPVQNVSDLIVQQVQRTPHRIALQFDQDIFLTYVQMDALSNNLAHKLIKSGVKRGSKGTRADLVLGYDANARSCGTKV
ncbi:amino acid adenylation [Ramaria rubella]|nr:amino acid adenylation [Ramaria rubella]